MEDFDDDFLNLIKISKELVEAKKKKKEKSSEVVSDLYSKSEHFIYELLQNTEDANAEKVCFKINENYLELIHNGRVFNYDDVEAITNIGNSSKTDLNTIGKFGIGFKSVYSITKTPHIISGKYNFKILDYLVPDPQDNDILKESKETIIRLPFEHEKKTPKEIYDLISEKLLSIKLENILFLKNIQEVIIKTDNNHIIKYSRNSKDLQVLNDIKVKKVSLLCTNNSNNQNLYNEYLVFSKNVLIENKNHTVEIAYKLENEKVVPVKTSKLFVFFETEQDTNLNFLIQGSYQTSKTRENILLSEENNIILLDNTADLTCKSILILKDMNMLNLSFFKDIIPLSSPKNYDRGFIYELIFNRIKNLLSSKQDKLLPTSENNFNYAHNLILSESKGFFENLLSSNQLKELFNKEDWISFNVTDGGEYRNLFIYLKEELSISSISSRSFVEKLNKEFLEKQDDEWVILLYEKLLDVPSLWKEYLNSSIARKKPIIRLEDNTHIEPFDNQNNPKVYLPNKNSTFSKYNIVKRNIFEDYTAKEFLTNLGLSEPDLYVELKEDIFPKYYRTTQVLNDNLEEIKNDFLKIIDCYKKFSFDINKKTLLFSDLYQLNFLLSKNNNDELFLSNAKDMYYPEKQLIKYFENDEEVEFLNIDFYKDFIDIELLNKFSKELDMKLFPEKVQVNTALSYSEALDLRENEPLVKNEKIQDFTLDGLETALENITKERSSIIWSILVKCLYNSNSKTFFDAIYTYSVRARKTQINKYFKSTLLKTLINHSWILDNKGNFCKPSEITIEEISDIYDRGYSASLLIDSLCFKEEISVESLPKNIQEELELGKKLKKFLNEGLSQNKIEELLNNALLNIKGKKENNNISNSNQFEKSVTQNLSYSETSKSELIADTTNNKQDIEKEDPIVLEGEEQIKNNVVKKDTNIYQKDENEIYSPDELYETDSNEDVIEEDLSKTFDNNYKKRDIKELDFNRSSFSSTKSKTDSLEKKKVSIENQIEIETKIEDLRKEISEIDADQRKYTFEWFKKVLRLEYELNAKESLNKGDDIKIRFSRVEKLSDNFVVLKFPSRTIPYYIEDLSDIPLKIFSRSRNNIKLNIDVVSVKDNAIKAKIKNNEVFSSINPKDFQYAQIEVKNLLFLLEVLMDEFESLPLAEEDDIKELLPNGLEFVFGPPGTGKTTHLANKIRELISKNPSFNILVLTPTNKAADVLAKKIVVQENNTLPEWLIRLGSTSDPFLDDLNISKDKDYSLFINPQNVVISTIARFPYDGFESSTLNEFNWDLIIFDEASMIGLAQILYVLYKQEDICKKFIIAGDPFQIPPITKAEDWKEENIYTLVELKNFEDEFTDHKSYPVLSLKKQYRSIPSIGELFSKFTYDGLLIHDRKIEDKKKLNFKGYSLNDITLIEFPVDKEKRLYKSHKLSGGSSYQIYSAIFAVEFVLALKEEIEKSWSKKAGDSESVDQFNLEELNKSKWTIGVICPYKAQALIIDQMITDLWNIDSNVSIIVDTVHGFQGDECDIIIPVLTPALPIGPNTFLNNQNILNVAISRARDYLIILLPEEKSEGFDNLTRINNLLSIITNDLKNNYNNTNSRKIEKLIFDNSKFISENTFITSHQKVNVYSKHAHRYEFRTKEGSIDGDTIDIHLNI